MSNTILINNGIILTNSYDNIRRLITKQVNNKFLLINDKKYLLDINTLIIILPTIDSYLELFDINKEVDLITQNQFLLYNGDWWVNIKNDNKIKKDLILNKQYKELSEFIEEEETVSIDNNVNEEIKKED